MIQSFEQISKLPTANKAVLLVAVQLLGVKEIEGNNHNQTILDLWTTINIDWALTDEVPWCAAAVNAILKLCGCYHFESGLARKGLGLPNKVDKSEFKPGDIGVFSRGSDPNKGHETILLRREGEWWSCMGGNQSNEFRVSSYADGRLLGVRRPTFIT